MTHMADVRRTEKVSDKKRSDFCPDGYSATKYHASIPVMNLLNRDIPQLSIRRKCRGGGGTNG